MIARSWTRTVASRTIAMALAGWWLAGCTHDEEPTEFECEKAADGTCRQQSQDLKKSCTCEDIYAPVCGQDGATYGNACEARCAKVPIAREGECKPKPE